MNTLISGSKVEAVVITVEENFVEMANELGSLIESRKQIEKQEEELKKIFKTQLGVGEVFETDRFTIVLSEKSRSSIDKDSLMAEFGSNFVDKHTKETKYIQLDVKAKK
jgi:hypothetical protein